MTHIPYCNNCEKRLDLCNCVSQDEFEAMLEEPDEETLERLKGSMPSTIMVLRGMRARHVPRWLRKPSCWEC